MTRTERIIAEVCAAWRIDPADLVGPHRWYPLSPARNEVFYRMRTELGLSYPRIGQLIGARHHTTVMHGIGRHYAGLLGLDLRAIPRNQFKALARKVPKRVIPPARLSDRPALRRPRTTAPAVCPIRAHQHRAPFVLQWVADGGTPLEALEPYGFTFGQASRFVSLYLPALSGLRGDQKVKRAREILAAREAAACAA